MAIAHVQDWSVAKAASVTTLQSGAAGSALTSGSKIIVPIAIEGVGADRTVSSVTDDAGNTYSLDKRSAATTGHDSFEIWSANNTTTQAANKITVNTSGSAYISFAAAEFTGLAASSYADGSGASQTGSSNAPSPSAYSTTNANDLLIEGYASAINTTATNVPTTPSTWSRVGSYAGGTFANFDSAYLIVSATQTSINPAFSTTGSGGWACAAYAYKQSSGGTTYTLSASGSSTPAGALSKQVVKAAAGSSTPAGAIAKQAQKPLAGSSTAAGALAKLAGKPLAGSSTPAGTLSTLKAALLALAGSVTAAGSLAKSIAKALAGCLQPGGMLAKASSKPLGGSVQPAGSLVRSALKGLSGAVTGAGSLIRAIVKRLAGAVQAAGSLVTSGGSQPPTPPLPIVLFTPDWPQVQAFTPDFPQTLTFTPDVPE